MIIKNSKIRKELALLNKFRKIRVVSLVSLVAKDVGLSRPWISRALNISKVYKKIFPLRLLKNR